MAWQNGGNRQDLADYFLPVRGRNYFIERCNFNSMIGCIDLSKKVAQFAESEMKVNFQQTMTRDAMPLGIGFTKWKPLENIGLKSPAPIVDINIKEARMVLNGLHGMHQYYMQNTQTLQDSTIYKSAYDNSAIDGDLQKLFAKTYSDASSNVAKFYAYSGGAADCYKKPRQCYDIMSNITNSLAQINLPQTVECFKYHYSVDIPVTNKDKTADTIHSQHITSGTCAEDLKFGCMGQKSSLDTC